MGALASHDIFGRQVDFNGFPGVVEDVQNWTSTKTWSEGGGGFVHPRYGGYIQAPTIRSRSTHHMRVRVAWEGGDRSIIDLPGNVHLSKGDSVILVAAENTGNNVWGWAGVVNVTTGNWFPLGATKDILKIPVTGAHETFGWMFVSALAAGAQAGALSILLLGAIFSAVLMVPLNWLAKMFMGPVSLGNVFWSSAALVALTAFTGAQKVLGRLKVADAAYVQAQHGALRVAMERAPRRTAPLAVPS